MDIVIYDGGCGICSATARWIDERDEANLMETVPYQRIDLEQYGLTEAETSQSVYLITEAGEQYHEARATFEILKRLPGIWAVVGTLLSNPVASGLARPAYRLVADNRTKISQMLGMTACTIPEDQLPTST